MVEYKYNAWGQHKALVLDSTGVDMVDCDKQSDDEEEPTPDPFYQELSQLNPFRYRGYYYDTETGLYYLKTRYYDPEVGRFISMDDISYLDPENINGLNLYAYCGNNPVMKVDPSGHIATLLIAAIIGGAIGGAFSGGIYGGLTAAANKENVWAGIIIGTLSGMVMGGAAGAGGYFFGKGRIVLGFLVPFGIGSVAGFCSDIVTQAVNKGAVTDWESPWINAGQWGALNLASALLGFGAEGVVENMTVGWITGLALGGFGLIADVLKSHIKSKAKEEAEEAVRKLNLAHEWIKEWFGHGGIRGRHGWR